MADPTRTTWFSQSIGCPSRWLFAKDRSKPRRQILSLRHYRDRRAIPRVRRIVKSFIQAWLFEIKLLSRCPLHIIRSRDCLKGDLHRRGTQWRTMRNGNTGFENRCVTPNRASLCSVNFYLGKTIKSCWSLDSQIANFREQLSSDGSVTGFEKECEGL